jgi:hypothetical protein
VQVYSKSLGVYRKYFHLKFEMEIFPPFEINIPPPVWNIKNKEQREGKDKNTGGGRERHK